MNFAAPTARTDFEIAIICALKPEVDAVEALFDVCWEDEGYQYGKAPGDPNAYKTGVLGGHNVVLAYLPGMGKINAAIVAASFRLSFGRIHLALVVGICGGIPYNSEEDETLWLGDVIVSNGLIQYDFGRQYLGKFVMKDTLNDRLGRQNIEIRSFLAKLKSRLEKKGLTEKTHKYVSIVLKELDIICPSAADDRLFNPSYRHKHQDPTSCLVCAECKTTGDKVCEAALDTFCSGIGCSEQEVARNRSAESTTSSSVHFGLMASGDAVMKSGEYRDEISRQMKVIGFDMEGAGVWDNFPCVIIKGICDYSDRHKSKGWQKYAAATAASCAKAFLEAWVSTSREVSDITPLSSKKTADTTIPFDRDDNFVGREEIIVSIKSRLLNAKSHRRVVLAGLGGVGKSQIAIEYAYRCRQDDPSLWVFWVYAANSARFEQSYSLIAARLDLPGWDDPKIDVLNLVSRWLADSRNGRWLMLLDNADDVNVFRSGREEHGQSGAQAAASLSSFIPQSVNGAVLITTRNMQVASWLSSGYESIIPVESMNVTEAAQLLRTKLPIDFSAASEIEELARELDCIPLAITQAGAYITARRMTVPRYLAFYRQDEKNQARLLDAESGDLRRDQQSSRNSVSRTWQISFDQIRRDHHPAAELLSTMAVLDRQGIPEFLLCKDGHSLDFEDAIAPLKDFSLVVVEKGGQSFEMHRLVQLVTRKWLDVHSEIEKWQEKAASLLAETFPNGNYENWTVCQTLLPHAVEILRIQASSQIHLLSRADLLYKMAWYQWMQGQYSTALKESRESLSVRQSLLEDDDMKVIESMGIVALVLHHQGRYKEAEELELQVMKTRKRLLGQEHPSTLTSIASLASTYRNQGRWAEAEELDVQVMETRKRLLGQEHPSTLTSIASLASTYWNQGRWAEAEELDVQVIETRKRALGQEHPDTLTSIGNLASTYWNQGRWAEAEELDMQVMETSKRVLGQEHPSTLTSIASLASTYRNQERWAEAEELDVQVIETRKRVLGQEHPDTLTSIGNLASTYWNQGRWAEAEELEVQVMETRKRVLGQEHPSTLTSIGNLASTYRNQGRWVEAEKLDMQVIETRKRVLGQEHPDTLTSIGNLASTYWNQGRWAEAEELEVQVMETSKRVLGQNHPSTLTTMNNLAFTWKGQGHTQRALTLMGQCIEGMKSRLGMDHPNTQSSLEVMSQWQAELEIEDLHE